MSDDKPLSGLAMMYLAGHEPHVIDVARLDIERTVARVLSVSPGCVPTVCVHPEDFPHVAAAVQLAKSRPGQPRVRVVVDSHNAPGIVTVESDDPEGEDEIGDAAAPEVVPEGGHCTCCFPFESCCASARCRNRGVDMEWTPEGWRKP